MPKWEQRKQWNPVEWQQRLLTVIAEYIFSEIAHVGVRIGWDQSVNGLALRLGGGWAVRRTDGAGVHDDRNRRLRELRRLRDALRTATAADARRSLLLRRLRAGSSQPGRTSSLPREP